MRKSQVVEKAYQKAEKREKTLGYPQGKHTVNMLFWGLLQVIENSNFNNREAIKELDEMGGLFAKDKLEPSSIGWELINILKKSTPEWDKESKMYSNLQSGLESRNGIIDGPTMIREIVSEPTEEIKTVLKNSSLLKTVGIINLKEVDEGITGEDKSDDNGIGFGEINVENTKIEDIVKRNHEIKKYLQSNVYGQNNAINAIADGLWNIEQELLSSTDKKGPRGVFVFAGAPGVGKTLMAGELAKVMRIPYKRFDMSSYSHHNAHLDLTGFNKTWKDSHQGVLTGFVAENPTCLLVFDEIEKAHIQVIQLFLQLLDSGILTDLYENEPISFKDVTVIFTTNAGRGLYNRAEYFESSTYSDSQIREALQNDIKPETGRPYFPEAIISRLSAGNIIMFNQLHVHALAKISKSIFEQTAKNLGNKYNLSILATEEVIPSLLLSEGGKLDARKVSADTKQFLYDELKKLVSLFDEDAISYTLGAFNKLLFAVDFGNEDAEIKEFFHRKEKLNLLFVGVVDGLPKRIRDQLTPSCNLYLADDAEEALELYKNHDIDITLLQIDSEIPYDMEEDGVAGLENMQRKLQHTINLFDKIPVGAADISARRKELITLHKTNPEIPIFILETSYFKIDKGLQKALEGDGASGLIPMYFQREKIGLFVKQIKAIGDELYIQKKMDKLRKTSQVIHFETTPYLDKKKKVIIIRLRNFSFEQIIALKDTEVMVNTDQIQTRFDDVIGADSAKAELQFFIKYMKDPKSFIRKGLRAPKGLLLYGMPGTGKTMLAKAMAGEAGVAYLSKESVDIRNGGAKAVHSLFDQARNYAPAIVFIDELDVLGRKRTGSEFSRYEEGVLTALMTEMDGVKNDPKRPVFVLGATNYSANGQRGGIGLIDEALVRRFDRAIYVEQPDSKHRMEFIRSKLSEAEYTDNLPKIKEIVDRSVGLSYADLENVLEFARRKAYEADADLTDQILDDAFEEFTMGEERKWNPASLERTARHEAGHAIMNYAAGVRTSYITIVARGQHGGYTFAGDNESQTSTKQALLEQIRCFMGGRAAEIVCYGADNGLDTGASSDLKKATSIAKSIVCRYGMDDELGLAVIGDNEVANPYFTEKVYTRVNQILSEQLDEAIKTIETHRKALDRLVERLLESNQLGAAEVEEIIEQFI